MTSATQNQIKPKYLRLRDDNGEWGARAEDVIEVYGNRLFEHERDPQGLLRFLLVHAGTCIEAVRPEPVKL